MTIDDLINVVDELDISYNEWIYLPKISHIAYNFTDDKEAFDIANKAGYKIDDSDVFYGDLNRKSFFIEDNNGTSIQLIKKKL